MRYVWSKFVLFSYLASPLLCSLKIIWTNKTQNIGFGIIIYLKMSNISLRLNLKAEATP